MNARLQGYSNILSHLVSPLPPDLRVFSTQGALHQVRPERKASAHGTPPASAADERASSGDAPRGIGGRRGRCRHGGDASSPTGGVSSERAALVAAGGFVAAGRLVAAGRGVSVGLGDSVLRRERVGRAV